MIWGLAPPLGLSFPICKVWKLVSGNGVRTQTQGALGIHQGSGEQRGEVGVMGEAPPPRFNQSSPALSLGSRVVGKRCSVPNILLPEVFWGPKLPDAWIWPRTACDP